MIPNLGLSMHPYPYRHSPPLLIGYSSRHHHHPRLSHTTTSSSTHDMCVGRLDTISHTRFAGLSVCIPLCNNILTSKRSVGCEMYPIVSPGFFSLVLGSTVLLILRISVYYHRLRNHIRHVTLALVRCSRPLFFVLHEPPSPYP